MVEATLLEESWPFKGSLVLCRCMVTCAAVNGIVVLLLVKARHITMNKDIVGRLGNRGCGNKEMVDREVVWSETK